MSAHGQILKFEIDYIISLSGKACRPVASVSLWRWRAQCPARKYFASYIMTRSCRDLLSGHFPGGTEENQKNFSQDMSYPR